MSTKLRILSYKFLILFFIFLYLLNSCTNYTKEPTPVPTSLETYIPTNTLHSTKSATNTPNPEPTITVTPTQSPADTDGDGLLAIEENKFGSSDRKIDSDGDGLDDFVEVVKYQLDPSSPDTDSDSIPDNEFHERQEFVDTTSVHVWARYMADLDKMNSLFQEVGNAISDDGILLEVELILYPNSNPIFNASQFDGEEDLSLMMGNYPQSNLSTESIEKIKSIAGEGTSFERALRLHNWFRSTIISNEQLPEDGWRRVKQEKNNGDSTISDFIFRQLKPDLEFSGPYLGYDDHFTYFSFTTSGKKEVVDVPYYDDSNWEFIHRFWFWRLWPIEMQFQIKQSGDCGSRAILLASLYQSIGIPARIVFETPTTNERYQHFYPEILLNGHWVPAEPTQATIGKQPHNGWVRWNSFDGAWLLENEEYTQWAFRQPDFHVLYGSLDNNSEIPQNIFPRIEYPSGMK